jgi:hypothetical protein
MNDKPNNFMMLGLHKLAAERGDGLIPELLALYKAQALQAEEREVLEIPHTKPAAVVVETPAKAAGNDNVIAFRPYLLAKRRR